MQTKRRMVGLVAACAVTAALAGAGGVAWSNHNFSDVGDGSFFDPSINAGADAGCFNGFPDGEFKGNRSATRSQFAFWLNNCGATVAHVADPNFYFVEGVGEASSTPEVLNSIDVDVKGSGTQVVELTATAQAFINETQATSCALALGCNVIFRWGEDGTLFDDTVVVRFANDFDLEAFALKTVVEAEAGPHTYDLVAFTQNVATGQSTIVSFLTMVGRTAPYTTEQPVPETAVEAPAFPGALDFPDRY